MSLTNKRVQSLTIHMSLTDKLHSHWLYTCHWQISYIQSLTIHMSLTDKRVQYYYHYYYSIDWRIYLKLSKSTQSAAGLNTLEAGCQWALLDVQIMTLLFPLTVQKYIELLLLYWWVHWYPFSKSIQSVAGLKVLKPAAIVRYLLCNLLPYYWHKQNNISRVFLSL